MVQKIAAPPPSGIKALWNLSVVGRATKPVRRDRFLTIAVETSDVKKDPASRQIEMIVSVPIVLAPKMQLQYCNRLILVLTFVFYRFELPGLLDKSISDAA